ncbi:hypothetical protein NLI96_g4658 [Meripilus lineatus]|uniref:F-box domain-containing protein n=1 Tax=Meripilus lineatus TaxID=2056292 RepID=A0AAD5YFH7_9APHY|nr:hypothetical protein NLI96_g4658 [Physisporinus lineatus]
MATLSAQRIDIEIACQKRHLSFLSTERNRRATAVKCPPEILTEIFCCVMRRIIANIGITSPKDQLVVSHVYHHWRAVVIRSQEYWSYQPIGRRGFLWSPEMVRRAGGQPLHLWMDIGRWRVNLQHRSRALCRAVSLHIPFPDKSHSKNVNDLIQAFPQSFPTLESITLTTRGIQTLDISDFTVFPRLRHLVVDGFSWSWNPLFLTSTLTHLTLRGPVDQIWGEHSWMNLAHLTNLANLDVTDTNTPQYKGNTSDFDFSTHTPTIQMRHLRCLRIAADPLSTTLFLQQLELTPLTSVSIDCTYLRRSNEDAANDKDFLQLSCLLKWLRRYFQALNKVGTGLHSLQIQEDPTGRENNAIILRLWSSKVPPLAPPRQNTVQRDMKPHFEIRLANTTEDTEDENENDGEDGYGKHLRNYLWRIVRWFRLTKLRNLHIDDSEMLDDPEKLFLAVPGVEVLSLMGSELDILLNALSSQGPTPGQCLLPALHMLVIHDSSYVPEWEVSDLMDHRLACRRPLQNVHIIRCPTVKSTFIEQLRNTVPNVEWERVEEVDEQELKDYLRHQYGDLFDMSSRSSIELEEEEEF